METSWSFFLAVGLIYLQVASCFSQPKHDDKGVQALTRSYVASPEHFDQMIMHNGQYSNNNWQPPSNQEVIQPPANADQLLPPSFMGFPGQIYAGLPPQQPHITPFGVGAPQPSNPITSFLAANSIKIRPIVGSPGNHGAPGSFGVGYPGTNQPSPFASFPGIPGTLGAGSSRDGAPQHSPFHGNPPEVLQYNPALIFGNPHPDSNGPFGFPGELVAPQNNIHDSHRQSQDVLPPFLCGTMTHQMDFTPLPEHIRSNAPPHKKFEDFIKKARSDSKKAFNKAYEKISRNDEIERDLKQQTESHVESLKQKAQQIIPQEKKGTNDCMKTLEKELLETIDANSWAFEYCLRKVESKSFSIALTSLHFEDLRKQGEMDLTIHELERCASEKQDCLNNKLYLREHVMDAGFISKMQEILALDNNKKFIEMIGKCKDEATEDFSDMQSDTENGLKVCEAKDK